MLRLFALLVVLAAPAFAVDPYEMLDDPALEARARALSVGLRCPVCRNENIDESSATLAADLRVVLRERLAAGDSDAQAVDYLVARYGEFILLRPNTSGANRVLWAAGPLLFLSALFIGWRTVRRRPEPVVESLSAAEQAKLDKILRN